MISTELIKKFGPAIIYQFEVYEIFKMPGRLSYQYLEEPNDEFIGLHSMVLIGVRTEGDRKVFLLQIGGEKKPICRSERHIPDGMRRTRSVRTNAAEQIASRSTESVYHLR